MDRRQHNQRIELLDHNLRAAVCQDIHGCQYDTEAVEQRNTAAEFVFSREFHMLARQQTIIGNVIVSQHDPFRETGCTGCVLHIDNIVRCYQLFGFN